MDRIGRGAMAEVWSARDLETGAEVAVKLAQSWASAEPELLGRHGGDEGARFRHRQVQGKIVEASAMRGYHDAKREALHRFERAYFAQLVEVTQGNVAEISRRTGLQRTHVRKYLRLHGLREPRG